MSQRILSGTGEEVLPGEDEVISPLTVPVAVYLPIIGDGTGGTVAAGALISVTTTNKGTVAVLDQNGLKITTVVPRHSKLFCAVETPGYGWSYMDFPISFPASRVTGLGAGGNVTLPINISDVTNLQSSLDGKSPLVHTHIIADTTGLQTALNGKAPTSHTHDGADITTGLVGTARLPISTTAAIGAHKVDNNSAGDPVALTASGHGAAADPHPQYALDTEKGAASGIATLDGAGKLTSSQLPLGTSASTAAAGNDSRLSDSRTPLAHASTHQPGGSDAMAVDAAAATGSLRTIGTGALQAAAGNDSRLSDARTPTAHVLDSATHTISGKTAGQFMRASGATAFVFEAVPFSRGGTLYKSDGIVTAVNIIVWRAPFACTVTAVKGYRVGGTGATINARKNGASNHLASDLSLTSLDTWMDGGSVQNTAYAAGDKMEIMIVSVAGSPTQVAVQIDFTRP